MTIVNMYVNQLIYNCFGYENSFVNFVNNIYQLPIKHKSPTNPHYFIYIFTIFIFIIILKVVYSVNKFVNFL